MKKWDDEKLTTLRKLIEVDMMTSSEAGKVFGCTRNAVVGACMRNGITLQWTQGGILKSERSLQPGSERPSRRGKNGRIAARINRLRFGDGPGIPPSPVAIERLERATPLPFLAVEVLDLQQGQCRYPHGEDHITFCGQPQREGSSYCDFHHRICRVGVSNELRYSPKTQAERSGTPSTDCRMASRASELAEPELDRPGDGEHQDIVGLDRLLAMGESLPGGEHAQGNADDESVGHGGLGPWQSIGSVADGLVRKLATR